MAGLVYQKVGIGYLSPTIGCGIVDEHYFKMCENLKYYLSLPLEFINPKDASYYEFRKARYKKEIDYPVAKLGDIEIWFTHYKSKATAKEKWERRIKRMNWDKIIIKWSQRNSLDNSLVERFLTLPFKNKIAFVTPGCDIKNEQIVTIPELEVLNIRGGDETPYTFKHFNVIKYLNSI